jgi:hypothetical protein
MSDVVQLNPPRRPAQRTSRDEFDQTMLKMCARWRVLRAQQQMDWAEDELADLQGAQRAPLDRDPLHQMKGLECHLAGVRPQSIALARELLRVHPCP